MGGLQQVSLGIGGALRGACAPRHENQTSRDPAGAGQRPGQSKAGAGWERAAALRRMLAQGFDVIADPGPARPVADEEVQLKANLPTNAVYASRPIDWTRGISGL